MTEETLNLTLKGMRLTQEQAKATVPVLNAVMRGEIKQKDIEEECLKAMAEAGYPLNTLRVFEFKNPGYVSIQYGDTKVEMDEEFITGIAAEIQTRYSVI